MRRMRRRKEEGGGVGVVAVAGCVAAAPVHSVPERECEREAAAEKLLPVQQGSP